MSEFLPTEEMERSMVEIGKTPWRLYARMKDAYADAGGGEEGARKALDVYNANRSLILEWKRILGEIDDFAQILTESLRRLEIERAKEEKRAVTIRGKGCVVVKLVPCGKHCGGCPHGPYAYEVYKVEGRQVWKYLGRAKPLLPT